MRPLPAPGLLIAVLAITSAMAVETLHGGPSRAPVPDRMPNSYVDGRPDWPVMTVLTSSRAVHVASAFTSDPPWRVEFGENYFTTNDKTHQGRLRSGTVDFSGARGDGGFKVASYRHYFENVLALDCVQIASNPIICVSSFSPSILAITQQTNWDSVRPGMITEWWIIDRHANSAVEAPLFGKLQPQAGSATEHWGAFLPSKYKFGIEYAPPRRS